MGTVQAWRSAASVKSVAQRFTTAVVAKPGFQSAVHAVNATNTSP